MEGKYKEGVEMGMGLGREEGYTVAKGGFDRAIQAMKDREAQKKANTTEIGTQTDPKTTMASNSSQTDPDNNSPSPTAASLLPTLLTVVTTVTNTASPASNHLATPRKRRHSLPNCPSITTAPDHYRQHPFSLKKQPETLVFDHNHTESPKPLVFDENTTELQHLSTDRLHFDSTTCYDEETTHMDPQFPPIHEPSHFPVATSPSPVLVGYVSSAKSSSTFENPTTTATWSQQYP